MGGISSEHSTRSQLYPNFVDYLAQHGVRRNVTLQDFSSRVIDISMQLGHNVEKHKLKNGIHLVSLRLKVDLPDLF
jgi:hypothetical protein